MESRGWRCKVLIREAFHKHDCSREFWDYIRVKGSVTRFLIEIIRTILTFRPSIILVRQVYELLPAIRLFAPTTPIILQFHGAEIRGKKKLPWQAKFATKRICSTKDIAQWGEYYGTPISPIFKPAPPGVRKPNTALFIRITSGAKDCLDEAVFFAKQHGLELTIIDRTKDDKIPHSKMPEVLQKYEWYLDLKGLTSKEVLSKTAIEFLQTTSSQSPGKVLTDTGDIVTSFRTTTLEDYYNLLEGFVNR